MKEPLWLKRERVDALHFQQLKRFGGLFGVRVPGAIESAIARPINQWKDKKERDPAVLAAPYGFGLTRNHGYSEGNKRVGFVAMAVFLSDNGYELEVPMSLRPCWRSPPVRWAKWNSLIGLRRTCAKAELSSLTACA